MSGLWTILAGNALLVAVLAGVAFLVSRAFRRPALTHLLWVLVLIKLITPPLLPWSISVSAETAAVMGISATANLGAESTTATAPVAASAGQVPSVHKVPSSADSAAAPTSFQAAAESPVAASSIVESSSGPGLLTRALHWLRTQWLLMCGLVWIAGTVVSVICIARLLVCLRRRFNSAEPIDTESSCHVGELASSLGLRRVPEVSLLDGIVSPLVWGVGSFTRIIFPRTLWEEMSPSSRDALLLHELAHYRRGDQWVRVLEIVVGCLYWWHPCVWWARRELAAAEEECCDAWVVRHAGHQPRNYAEAIITTLDYLAGEPVHRRGVTTGVNTMPVLRRRLRHIMQKTVSPVLPQSVRWGLLAAATMMFPLRPLLEIAPSSTAAASSAAQYQFHESPRSVKMLLDSVVFETETRIGPDQDGLPAPQERWWDLPTSQAPSFITSPDGRFQIEIKGGQEVVAVINKTGVRRDLTEGQISCFAFTPDGKRFVAGSRTGDVRVWDPSDGHAVSTLGQMGEHRVTSIDVTRDGAWVVTGNDAGSVMTWEIASGSSGETWTTDSRINCVRVIDEARIAVSTGRFDKSGRIIVLDAATLKPYLERTTEQIIATIEPDGQSGAGLLLTDYAGAVWSWDGLSTELTLRGRIPTADRERAAISSAFRLSIQL